MKILHFFSIIILASFFNSCTPNNVTIDDLPKQYFDANKVTGCFALYDNGQNHFDIYNLSRYRDSSYSPSSTFDIVSSLIAIETGIVANETSVTKMNYLSGSTADANRPELSMQQAFNNNEVD
jgi:beta-lactamase class D